MKREKDLYNEDVKQLKLELEAKKKDLDKTRKILEDRITRADNIFERLKALSLMLHIKQRESIEVLKDFNIQATKLSRHGDSLEEIVKYAEKLGKDFKELKRITKD